MLGYGVKRPNPTYDGSEFVGWVKRFSATQHPRVVHAMLGRGDALIQPTCCCVCCRPTPSPRSREVRERREGLHPDLSSCACRNSLDPFTSSGSAGLG
jgi:hypothetical protein